MKVGQHHSNESKKKMSDAKLGSEGWNKGLHWSDEIKAKMSAARKGKPAWNKGISPSAETLEKQRLAHLGHRHSPETRKKLGDALRAFAETRKGIHLEGSALEKAQESIKKCIAVTRQHYVTKKHWISEIDRDKRTGTCSLCGRVPLSTDFGCRLSIWRARYLIKVCYPGQALEAWEAQQGNCAICKQTMKLQGIKGDCVAVDHDHKTHYFRGFIHNNCNRMLGYAGDDPVRLRAAAEYLERTSFLSVE